MYIIIKGNVVDGLKFIGHFMSREEAARFGETEVSLDDGEWWIAPMEAALPSEFLDEPKYVITNGYNIRKVNLKNMWTVIHSTYIDELPHEVKGGDHHWLSYDLAVAARKVYEVCPAYHGKLPSEVQEAFGNYFPDETWPVIEAAVLKA